MKKILLCSPYYKDKENTTCGIANWTRNIMSKLARTEECHVELLPYDRSVDLDEESSYYERLKSGIKDYLGIVFKTKDVLKKDHYDLMQVSTSASLGLIRDWLLLKLAKRYHTKIVFHFHFGRMPEILEASNWESKLMRSILKQCTAAIVMDSKSYNSLKAHGYENVYYLPNPLSDKIFDYIKTNLQGAEREKGELLFVGHVVKTKGVYELVEACSQIENVRLKLIGKVFTETKQGLIDIAQKRDNGSWLEFVGEIPHKEVLKQMSVCDMFVLPTYSEGFPNVILESMACGCPIIASDVGAIREMLDIDNKPCGVIIQPQQTGEVIDAILSLKDNEELKKSFGLRAAIRIREQYCVDVVCNQLESIWQKI